MTACEIHLNSFIPICFSLFSAMSPSMDLPILTMIAATTSKQLLNEAYYFADIFMKMQQSKIQSPMLQKFDMNINAVPNCRSPLLSIFYILRTTWSRIRGLNPCPVLSFLLMLRNRWSSHQLLILEEQFLAFFIE